MFRLASLDASAVLFFLLGFRACSGSPVTVGPDAQVLLSHTSNEHNVLLGSAPPTEGRYVPDITFCPALPPREPQPKDVHDLRPDDISVVMAVGDSITAAAFAKGFQVIIPHSFAEWRGVSFAAGMDDGAITVPNAIKYYNPNVRGGSIGKHNVPKVCYGGPICSPDGWDYNVDQFNAARSGAFAQNLLSEIRDYLVPQLQEHEVKDEEFKYLNFQIGSNDLCQLCLAGEVPRGPFPGSPDSFEFYVRQALDYMREHVPNTVVNMIGVLPVSGIYNMTKGHDDYCSYSLPNFPHYSTGCACALADSPFGDWVRSEMDKLQGKYNERLLKIVKHYQKLRDPHFAVLWQPAVMKLSQWPVEGLSTVDCFHPSIATHERIAVGIWNRLTLGPVGRSVELGWEGYPQIRCLEPGDRLQTNAIWGGL